MYTRIPALRRLPELSLAPPAVAPRRLRQPTHPAGMSTIEAIAGALGLLENEALGNQLRAVFDDFVKAADSVRGRVR
jgi:DTW domain-containing protein YfiP